MPTYWKVALTNNITKAGRLGICKSPSRNIGSEAPAANDAGIINIHVVFGHRSSGRENPIPQRESNPSFVFKDLELRYSAMQYATNIARKEWNAIVKARHCQVERNKFRRIHTVI